jgi:hypothetical protein
MAAKSDIHPPSRYVVRFDPGGRDDQLEKRNQQPVGRESVSPNE